MFGTSGNDAFVNHAAPPRAPRAGWLILAVLALLGGFGWWAATYEIEEVARASGRVVPSGQVQVVQSLEGGILRAVEVAEGDIVEAGQVLVRIDDTAFQARLGELRQQEAALLGQRARLEAEAEGRAAPVFAAALDAFAQVTQAEAALFGIRRAQLAQELDILRGRQTQREAELAEQQARLAQLEAVIVPLREELALSENMLRDGIMPRIEVLRLRARVAEQEGEIAVTRAAAARLEAAIDEATREVAAARSKAVLEARAGLAEVQARLAVVQETLKSAQDRVARTALRAPLRGTVNALHATTLGSVIQPGAPVVDIVPLDGRLRIEADLSPRDVAFIHPQARASVKLTAYDYAIYGSLAATVERISADAFVTEDGASFFRVDLRTEDAHLGPAGAPLPVIPGMVAQVDIQTGRKTVLDYLAKPLLRARAEALRER